MQNDKITMELFNLQDIKYRDFQIKLIPGLSVDSMIGIRTPVLRDFARKLYKNEPDQTACFLEKLPHRYFDENQLHSFILCLYKDFDACLFQINKFLPYVDNWATCDQLSPKVFKKHLTELLPYIHDWLKSSHTFTCRFAIDMLIQHYLDESFSLDLMDEVASIKSDEYYVNMAIAWYFATALAKQYDAALPYIEEGRLSPWVHRKTIQKAVESFRVTDLHKQHLLSLK